MAVRTPITSTAEVPRAEKLAVKGPDRQRLVHVIPRMTPPSRRPSTGCGDCAGAVNGGTVVDGVASVAWLPPVPLVAPVPLVPTVPVDRGGDALPGSAVATAADSTPPTSCSSRLPGHSGC